MTHELTTSCGYSPTLRDALPICGLIAPAVPVQWTNRIHSDDCAGVLAHLIECEMRGEALANLYVGSDCAPVSAHMVQSWLAQRLRSEERRVGQEASTRGGRRR